MNILIAPDSFKESLSAQEAASAIEDGFRLVFPNASYRRLPMADGGEGTSEALVWATQGQRVPVTVQDPLGRSLDAFFVITGDGQTAIIEIAQASGLERLRPEERNPELTTSFGTGQLIGKALDMGLRHLVIGLGGSATNDCGAGLLMALGVRLLDKHGQAIAPTGGGLGKLASIDISLLDPRLSSTEIEVACDVDNPLTGPNGASMVFGPQKGASPEQVAKLDRNLRHFANLAKDVLGLDMESVAGGGAAGGTGAALYAFLNGRLRSGLDIVAELVHLEQQIIWADLVITGEGCIDGQSLHGKTPVGIARIAKRHGKAVIAIGGSLLEGAESVLHSGIDAIASTVCSPQSLSLVLQNARRNLQQSAQRVACLLKLGKTLPIDVHN
ncbi:MAG: glycerate kinase [Desulfovibrio sp.]|nr:glycerate kinase [Desulfovibrio sp.]